MRILVFFLVSLLPVPVFPQQKIQVQGKVADHRTGEPLKASIRVIETSVWDTSQVFADSLGKFSFYALQGREYELISSYEGYLHEWKPLATTISTVDTFLIIEMVKPKRTCGWRTLRCAPFELNSSVLQDTLELSKVAELLNMNPGIGVEVSGMAAAHEKKPEKLASQRAAVVCRYLLDKGLEAKYVRIGEAIILEDKDHSFVPKVDMTVFEVK